MNIYDITFLRAKIHQEMFWQQPNRKIKHRTKKMSDEDFEKYNTIANQLLNDKK